MNRPLDDGAAGQITAEAAEVYEARFVPALFGQFAAPLVRAGGAMSESRVLDVACGTGCVARAARAEGAEVTAIDINEGMLAVARRQAPDVDFRRAAAEDLPFDADGFDSVLCQFGLMFFADRTAALREMARVCAPGGRVAVAVFEAWENSPGYSDLIPLIDEIVGRDAADALKAPFVLGGAGTLEETLAGAGLHNARIETVTGVVRQPSLDAWFDTEIGGWTLAAMVDDNQLADLKAVARGRLAHLTRPDGRVRFPSPARIAVASV